MRGLLANVKTKIKKSSRKSIHAAWDTKKKQKTENKKAKSKNDCRSTPWDRKLSQSSSAYACMQKRKKVTLNTNHHVLFHALSRTSLYSLSTTIADAAPPPLQMAATPFSPFFKACTKVTTIREPEEPIGYACFFFHVSSRNFSPAKKKRRRRT